MLPFIRTVRADEDLIDIWLGIAIDSPSAVDRVLDAIQRHWQQLSLYPYSGVARDDIAPGLRCLVVGQLMTLYRVAADGILIIRVLHGRRKIGQEVA